jgi:phospholipid/cholesterol/gamma-HCH transport system substrate-binding protein
METRAPFVVVGAFVLAAIAAVFGFVYWLHNTGGIGPRATYHVQFDGSVPGLMVGAAVLFNGIRVGEVTDLGLAPDSPRRVNATISVASMTPVRSDTKVGLEFQGLTGVPVIALEGGMLLSNSGEVSTLIADPGAGEGMTQAARSALRRVDSVLADNAEPLKSTIANLQVFSEGLARNTGKLDGIVAGLERMTGAGTPVQKITYDARDPADAVLSAKGCSGIFRVRLGRRDTKAAPGPIDRELRELRSRPRTIAHDGCRTGRLPASDRRQALSDRGGFGSGGSNRIVGANRRQGWKSRRVAFVRREREI